MLCCPRVVSSCVELPRVALVFSCAVSCCTCVVLVLCRAVSCCLGLCCVLTRVVF